MFLSASETHNRKNVNRSIEESLAGLERVLAPRARGGAALRGRHLDLASAAPTRATSRPSGCSQIAARLRDAGAEEVAFGDTTGMANPRQVGEFFAPARAALGAASS